MDDYFLPEFTPFSNQKAIVLKGNFRITVLTDKLFRIEYDPDKLFEDRPSQVFWHREQPIPTFSWNVIKDHLLVETDCLRLAILLKQKVLSKSISIQIKETGFTWRYGDTNYSNLKGTYRTLDETGGEIDLDKGLNSLNGWSVVDDTPSLVFDESGWLTSRGSHRDYQDLYFFGYGRDYKACIQDFQKVSGDVPLLPRWALGNWWSRYWEYSDQDLLCLMDDFRNHQTPLSVCIIDMDWHITKTGNTSLGWTGYTWNTDLFPNPEMLLTQLHQQNLHVALNLHPAEGIHPHEAKYPQIIEKLGLDPFSEAAIPFDCANKQFMQAYFDILHHPLEKQGVDFWWLDWQQGESSCLQGLDPLFSLNHLHSMDIARTNSKRAFIFSRWPGLGGHRYPIGFSGDTWVSWDSLAFQPYFTATAANVGFGWWSHDIGGHMKGTEDPELYLRWVQYGVFSPIFRLHSTKNIFHERRPWGYDAEIEKNAISAMQQRRQLIPYIYSAARKNSVEGIPLVTPLYFQHPHEPAAYQCPSEYYFGESLIAAPFTTPKDLTISHSRQVVWLPEGTWYDYFTGEQFIGDRWYALYGALSDIPVFAKAGAIIPLDADKTSFGADNPLSFEIKFFAGEDGSYTLYEDDGTSQAYRNGFFSEIKIDLHQRTDSIQLVINSAQGRKEHLPIERAYTFRVFGINPPDFITVNGVDFTSESKYLDETNELRIYIPDFSISSEMIIDIQTNSGILVTKDRWFSKLMNFLQIAKCPTSAKSHLISHLQEYLAEPSSFLEVIDNFSKPQLLAIAEILSGGSTTPIAHDFDEAIRNMHDSLLRGKIFQSNS